MSEHKIVRKKQLSDYLSFLWYPLLTDAKRSVVYIFFKISQENVSFDEGFSYFILLFVWDLGFWGVGWFFGFFFVGGVVPIYLTSVKGLLLGMVSE